MARKPISTAHMEPSIDRSNMVAIQKRFTSEAWDELLDTAFNLTNSASGTPFNLQLSWQEIKDTYAEVYICVKGTNDLQHTIIIPTDMINKEYSTAKFNLTPSNGVFMWVTLGGLADNSVSINSMITFTSSRLVILAR